MENKQDGIIAFDTLFTNNHICMMKLLLPILPPSRQKTLAIYIKYQELQYTLQYFTRHPSGFYIPGTSGNNGSPDFNTLFENLLPYCTPGEKENISQVRNMLNSFRNMQEMLEMVNMIKEMFPEGLEGTGDGIGNLFAGGDMNNLFGGGDMSTLFAGMSNIFGMANDMFTGTNNTSDCANNDDLNI